MRVNIANHDGSIIWDGIYYFALSDYPRITLWELKKLIAFIEYEKRHDRRTEILCDDEGLLSTVNNTIAHPEIVENAVFPAKITECGFCNHKGCLTRFVCHTADNESAAHILADGKLLSSVKAFKKSADELVGALRNGAGDPADYFDYIMLSWGNCWGGDSLIVERNLVRKIGRMPSKEELDEEINDNFTPGVRFYFRHEDILRYPGYVFDGYHPAKVKDEIVLSDWLFACIIPEQYKQALERIIPPEIAHKVHYLPLDGLRPLDWSEKVYDFVERLEEKT